MNKTIQELMRRKSVRAFTKQPITAQIKRILFQAAMEAPTAGNQQLYTILDITDQTLKERLAETCDHQPFIAGAQMVLVFCADCQKWFDAYLAGGCEPRKPLAGDLMLAVTDAAIAAQNMVTAAESLGIGSCYIGDIMENFEINRKLLHLPKYALPYSMVVFGKPTQQQKDRIKPKRFELQDIVHTNTYRQKTIEETICMFEKQSEKTGKEFAEYIKAFANRKFYVDFRKEMNRSAKAMLKQWTD